MDNGSFSILLQSWGVANLPGPVESMQLDDLRQFLTHLSSLNRPSDDRYEINASPPVVQELARSVALICDATCLIQQKNGIWELQTASAGLLSGQVFSAQPRVPEGFTGFLVGNDLLLTTAHDVPDVSLLRVIFDFKLASNGVAKTTYASSEIFTVKREIARRQDENTGEDWLLLRLDRSPGRPFQEIASQPAPLGTSLWMLGHPLGLPMKFVDGATVMKEGSVFFECDLDASQGNSGSMVMAAGSKVVGVLRATAAAVQTGLWLWCPPGGNCPTSVTSSSAFAGAVATALGQ